MGIRQAIARCFGGGSGSTDESRAAKEAERARRKSEKILSQARRLINTGPFVPDLWSQQIMKNYASSLGLGDIFKAPEEKVCPLTKQLIVEQLRDMAAAMPGSVRSILGAAMADGVKDDYELLERLVQLSKKPEPPLPDDLEMDSFYNVQKMGHTIRFRSKKANKEYIHFSDEPPPVG